MSREIERHDERRYLDEIVDIDGELEQMAFQIQALKRDNAALRAEVEQMERLNCSTHGLKEAYKKGWIEWSGKAYRFRKLFKLANAKKRAALNAGKAQGE